VCIPAVVGDNFISEVAGKEHNIKR
jgi:hypothetical protein